MKRRRQKRGSRKTQMHSQTRPCQMARWRFLRPTQVPGKDDRDEQRQPSAGDPSVSLRRAPAARFEAAAEVDPSFLTPTPSPILIRRRDAGSRRSAEALWTMAWTTSRPTLRRR